MNRSTQNSEPKPAAASRIARLLPARLLVSGLARAHRRVEPELAHLDAFLPDRRRTAIDVGAWYGPWTLALAARFDRVHSFEANPTVASALRRCLPPGVTLHEAAASDGPGWAVLRAPSAPGTEGVGSIHPLPSEDPTPQVGSPSTRRDGTVTEAPVTTVRIDDLALRDVDLIKIDVEGHELAVLGGAERTLERDRPVVVVELEEHRAPTAPVIEVLEAFGLRPHTIVNGRLRAFDTARLQDQAPPPPSYTTMVLHPDLPRPVNNVIFLPEGHRGLDATIAP